jgi:tetratricopeptide (TPR) repeat protein
MANILQDVKQWRALGGLAVLVIFGVVMLVRYAVARAKIKTWSGKAVAANQRGHEATLRGELDKAIEEYGTAIEHDPRFAKAYANRGRTKAQRGDFSGAIADCDEALRLDPHDIVALLWRGIARDNAGRADEALADYDEVIRRDPKQATAFVRRAGLRRRKGDEDGAMADCDAAIRADADAAPAYFLRADIHESRGKMKEALADLAEAARKDPGRYRILLGNFLYRTGRVRESIAEFDEVLRANPDDADAYNFRGIAWFSSNEFDRAIADYTEAIRLDPGAPFFYSNRGYSRRKAGDLDGAVKDFDKALSLDPSHDHALKGRAIAHARRGDAAAAQADLRRLRQAASEEAPAFGADVKLLLGDAAGAFSDLGEALRKAPNDPFRHNGIAWRRATFPDDRARDGAEAVRHATEACRLSGGRFPTFLDTLAAAYAESGDFARAVAAEQAALRIVSEDERAGYEARLEHYRAGKPFREPIL